MIGIRPILKRPQAANRPQTGRKPQIGRNTATNWSQDANRPHIIRNETQWFSMSRNDFSMSRNDFFMSYNGFL
jgi:hypothetical protein